MVRRVVESPLGDITLVASDSALKGLWIAGQTIELSGYDALPPVGDNPVLREAESWLRAYFEGKRPSVESLPLEPDGSDFRRLIGSLMLQIPYGETATYGELAAEAARLMGKDRMSAQAVGGAVGANPISIIIPCHRVMGAGGRVTGYAGGVHLKLALLRHEGVDTSGFIMPK